MRRALTFSRRSTASAVLTSLHHTSIGPTLKQHLSESNSKSNSGIQGKWISTRNSISSKHLIKFVRWSVRRSVDPCLLSVVRGTVDDCIESISVSSARTIGVSLPKPSDRSIHRSIATDPSRVPYVTSRSSDRLPIDLSHLKSRCGFTLSSVHWQ